MIEVLLDTSWCLFFFSSRRRHTRWPRDWSSDVCSSDLDPLFTRSLDELFGISEEEPGEEAVRDERGERRVRYMAYRGIDLGGSIAAGPYQTGALYSQYHHLSLMH